ncbi:MAG: hypothetical protein M5U25_17490 [Planctomycetota bacterium]|nr:hypothetical protein [Planctomycetota bacterium]
MIHRKVFGVLAVSVLLFVVAACVSGGKSDAQRERESERREAEAERKAKNERDVYERTEKAAKQEAEAKEADRLRRIESQPESVRELILAHQVTLGMTAEQVELSWGPPHTKNRTVTKYGVSEQWVYGYADRWSDTTRYLYFDDDILTSWQE